MPTITYPEELPQRVDKFLAKKYPEFSRRFFQDGLKNKEILINGKSKSPSYKLKEGDEIEIKLSLKKPAKITELPPNEKVSIEVVAKYPDFLIINKPVGLVVHPSIFDVRNNSIPPTLAGGLIAEFPELQKVGEDFTRPGIVHRLDKNTSGLMIVPLTQKSFEEFKKMFRHHLITKTYLALSWNLQKGVANPKSYKEPKLYKTISTPIGKSTKEHTKQATAKNPGRLINPKEAITLYKIIGYDKFPCRHKVGKIKKQEKTVALIKAKPQTGRKHQIRVHLSSIGLPLVGDSQYTSRLLKNCNKNFPYHLLQAHKLEFTYRGKKYSFTAPAPEWLENDS